MLKKLTAFVLSAMLLTLSLPVSTFAADTDNAQAVSAAGQTEASAEKAEGKAADSAGTSDEAEADTALTYSVSGDQVTVTGLSGECPADLVIPEAIENLPVTEIAANAFSGCGAVTGITVPDSVTAIGAGAFQGTNPTKVTLPFIGNSRTAKGPSGVFGYIFGYDSSDSAVSGATYQYTYNSYDYYYYIPQTLREVAITDDARIPENAFDNCSRIEKIHVNQTIEAIGKYAFYACASLTAFDIPDSVSVLNDFVFSGCKSLTAVRFPASLTLIGTSAFSGCSSLETGDLVIPDGVTAIGSSAFYGCSGITGITVPDSVTSIGAGAFKGLNPEKVTLPFVGGSKTAAGPSGVFGYIFGYLYSGGSVSDETTFQYPDGTYYKYCYYIPATIREVVITNADRIPQNAFYNCSRIEKVTVNDIGGDESVVGSDAFFNCPAMTVFVNRGTGVHTCCERSGIRHCSTKSLSLESDSLVLFRNETGTIGSEVILLNGKTDDAPETVWTSSDPEVAAVNRYTGEITSVAPGTATITADSEGVTATAEVTVCFRIESITLNKPSARIDIGRTETLAVTYSPENTTDEKTVTWTSSDESVATVDTGGTVTAVGKGRAAITATAENGLQASCTVEVLVPVTEIAFESSTVSIPRSTMQRIPFTLSPGDYTDTFTVTSSDTDVAAVDPYGNVTARKVGTAVITVTTSRGLAESCVVTVFSPAASVTLSSGSETLFVSRSAGLKAELSPFDTTDKVTWSSSDDSIAAVDENGKVTGLSKGRATITATADSGVSADCEITVESGMETTVVYLAYNECEYDAEDKTPEVFVYFGDERLAENTDYSLTYFDNRSAGEAGVIITSLYDGTEVTKRFTIHPLTVTALDIRCRQTMTYTGDALKGVEEITYKSLRLTEGVDYELEYKNNTDAGRATVTVTGAGNFTGLTTKSFLILVKPISETSITLANTTYRYDGQAKTPGVTVRDGAKALEEGKDYSVSYENNRDAGDALVTVSGTGNYGSFAEKKFTIERKSLSDAGIALGNNLFLDDGTAHRPKVTVTVGETVLKRDADYSLQYKNNSDAGIATVVVTGIGNYIGTASEIFEILTIGDVNGDGKVNISDATAIQNYLAEIEDFNEKQLLAADANGGGEITIADVTQIQKYAAELIERLG